VRLIADFSCDLNVRFGSEADISAVLIYVRFTPKSGHRQVHGREAREIGSNREIVGYLRYVRHTSISDLARRAR